MEENKLINIMFPCLQQGCSMTKQFHIVSVCHLLSLFKKEEPSGSHLWCVEDLVPDIVALS